MESIVVLIIVLVNSIVDTLEVKVDGPGLNKEALDTESWGELIMPIVALPASTIDTPVVRVDVVRVGSAEVVEDGDSVETLTLIVALLISVVDTLVVNVMVEIYGVEMGLEVGGIDIIGIEDGI